MKLIYIGDSGGISGVLQRAMEGAALTNLRCGRSGSNELAVVDAGIFKGRTQDAEREKGGREGVRLQRSTPLVFHLMTKKSNRYRPSKSIGRYSNFYNSSRLSSNFK